jgi:uncharacterized membrane protein
LARCGAQTVPLDSRPFARTFYLTHRLCHIEHDWRSNGQFCVRFSRHTGAAIPGTATNRRLTPIRKNHPLKSDKGRKGKDLTSKEKRIRQFFLLSVSLKGIHSVIEIVGGLLLLVVPPDAITRFIVSFTQEELLEDPHDLIANYALHVASTISLSTTIFGGLYLLSHGIIKIILVIALLKNKLWAYPWSLVVLGSFILFQIYRFTFTHSLALIVLTVFDLAVIWLIWREYQIVRTPTENAVAR